jgi:hypothetical protein
MSWLTKTCLGIGLPLKLPLCLALKVLSAAASPISETSTSPVISCAYLRSDSEETARRRLRARIIGRDRDMLRCHQLLDVVDVLLLEGLVERGGRLVDLGDRLGVAGPGFDKTGCGENRQDQESNAAQQ